MYYPGIDLGLFLAMIALSTPWVLGCCYVAYRVEYRRKKDPSYTLHAFWGFEKNSPDPTIVIYTIIVSVGVWIILLTKAFLVLFT